MSTSVDCDAEETPTLRIAAQPFGCSGVGVEKTPPGGTECVRCDFKTHTSNAHIFALH